MRTFLSLLGIFFSLSLLTACAATPAGGFAQDLGSRQIKAVATTGLIADVVQNVGGERVQVTSLMGVGVDPHLYKPSERSVVALADADVIFYNGLHLEAGMAKVFERMAGPAVKTVAVTDGIDRGQSFFTAPPEFQGHYDPHVWFDVGLWKTTANTVRDALIEMDPAAKRPNLPGKRRCLPAAEAGGPGPGMCTPRPRKLPEQQRVLVTAHDAFNYFGRAYGFKVRGFPGISTGVRQGLPMYRNWQTLLWNDRSRRSLLNLRPQGMSRRCRLPCARALTSKSAAPCSRMRWETEERRKELIKAWCDTISIPLSMHWHLGDISMTRNRSN